MHSKRVTILTQESIAQFQNSLFARGCSQQTIKAYSTDLRMLLKELGVTEIHEEDLKPYALNWLNFNRNRVAASTIQRRKTSLKIYSEWAGFGNDLFSDYRTPPVPRGTPHPLPEGMEGVDRLINVAVSEDHKVLITLCGRLGLRISEALSVTGTDFNFVDQELRVFGKGEKVRHVPISPEAWSVLIAPLTRNMRRGGNTPLVSLEDRAARRVITSLGRRAGLKRAISSHDLRATFATAVYDKCLDLRVVQELLGHSNSATTELYVGRTKSQMRDAVKGL